MKSVAVASVSEEIENPTVTIQNADILRRRAGSSVPSNSEAVPSDISTPIIMQSGAVEQFDAVRREATKLERVLEEKLAKYQQVRLRGCVACNYIK
jgi:hypothetical protein